MRKRLFTLLLICFMTSTLDAQTNDNLPLTWQRDYFPEFRIDIAPADLDRMLNLPLDKNNPDLTKYPITLNYQGQAIEGTIRLRGGNASRCGAKRQFRIDFPKRVTLPDGYKTDRFETDHGICNTLNEWAGWQLIDEAATRHPEMTVLRKHSNVTAIYFNGQLYHVQTLLEDVSKDVIERHLQTRNVTQYKHGCYTLPTEPTEVTALCDSNEIAFFEQKLDVREYLYVNALIQVIGSADMYPAYPWNWYLIYNQDNGRTHFLPHDLDMAIDYVSGIQHDPFTVVFDENRAQHHFQTLVADPQWGEIYRQYVTELTELIAPGFYQQMVAMKYEQVREKLLASPELPFGAEYYDDQYLVKMLSWSSSRYTYLKSIATNPPRPRISFLASTLYSDSEPYAVTVADFNRDGTKDMAIANIDAGLVTLISGVKDGLNWTGGATTSLYVGGNPNAIESFDINNDGWADLLISDYTGNVISLWINQQDGSFRESSERTYVPLPLSVNAFRKSDGSVQVLAIADGEEGKIYRSQFSDGVITETSVINVGAWAQPPSFGDLNRDGQLDAITANFASRQLTTIFSVLESNPQIMNTTTAISPGGTAIADFTGDGWPDVAVLSADENKLFRLKNLGDGTLLTDNVVSLPTGYWQGYYASLATGDFDGDGIADVTITDYSEGIIRVFRGSTSDGFENGRCEWVGTGNKGYGTIAPDLNEDGKPDIVALAGRQSWVSIHLNQGGFR